MLLGLHPAHGKLTLIRVLRVRPIGRAIHTRFRYGSGGLPLAKPHAQTRRLILQ